jgi:hypothetical protein
MSKAGCRPALRWQCQVASATPFLRKMAWTSGSDPLHFPHLMKCDTMNSVLTFVLGVFVVLGVIFALQAIFRTREFRTLQITALQDQATLAQIQQVESLARDAMDYNKNHPSPELARILQAAQTKPAGK